MNKRLLLIDGNSIMNRAFYGIMGNKMLSSNGKYTNAVYGFLAILFKNLEDLNPDYIAVSFDLKAKTERHKLYERYKANRHGMPEELAQQMPMIKEVLKAMNIDIVEMEGYEGDDILGTLSKYGEKQNLDVTILSGDRDTFQLATDKVTIRIPRTKQGKTETDEYDRKKVIEEYGLEPKALIEVKGLQGDTSDNIPGVPGIGPKTAISLIQKYGTIENLYKSIEEGTDDLKGKNKESIIENKDMAFLSRTLGEINVNVPIEDTLEELKTEEWDRAKVLELFREWNFKRFIERFNLEDEQPSNNTNIDLANLFKIEKNATIEEVEQFINNQKRIIFYLGLEDDLNPELIIKSKVTSISIYNNENNTVYSIKNTQNDFNNFLKRVFENNEIEKLGYELSNVYIILKQMGITINNMKYDITVGAYILDPSIGKYLIDGLIEQYLNLSVSNYLAQNGINEENSKQITLFDSTENQKEDISYKNALYVYAIGKMSEILTQKLKEQKELELFETIDMPTIEVLANMQWNGMKVNENDLIEFGRQLKEGINLLTQEIYELAGEEFNINSPKQLGEILFDKMKLTVIKKTKSGYSTAEDVLEKLKKESPIIEKILDYRQLAKLNSTYVEGMRPFINPKTGRIHSFFHQTITATGRISSTEPNLQNIPTRIELGKRLRKVFIPEEGHVYIDADYSQIELRVLAHMSEDVHMIEAFEKGEDIHKQAASKVLHKPIEEITKEERSNAKAVNFGIVYGISDFGLGEQLGIGRKAAKAYIDQYLEEYSGIKKYMEDIVETAKLKGYAQTQFGRRRYIQELKSSNYMVREFGKRAAMNTPIQGTAADIMKIAMIKVYNKIKEKDLKSKIVLQVHDEMMIEAPIEEKEQIKEIIKQSMESAAKLKVPLIADISEANNWYDCK
ncbi:MAG TPA: DNA polymerase I [Clostridiales bacterium]|nr:DNA polymerase I [Clostridiales bacterium]